MAARRVAFTCFALILGLGFAPATETSAGGSDLPGDLGAPAGGLMPALSDASGDAHDRSPPPDNPLWSVPIERLSTTRDKPLFSPSRRPPPSSAEPVSTLPVEKAAPVVVVPVQPPPTLLGTIIGRSEAFALLRDAGTNRVVKLRPGEADAAWRLQSLDSHSAIVEMNGQMVTLPLAKPQADASPQASTEPPPSVPGMKKRRLMRGTR